MAMMNVLSIVWHQCRTPQLTNYSSINYVLIQSCVIYDGRVCAPVGVGRSVHPGWRSHWPLLSHHGSGCWSSHVRCPDLHPSSSYRPHASRRWQVGRSDPSRNHPCKSHRQCSRFVLQHSYWMCTHTCECFVQRGISVISWNWPCKQVD